MTLAPFFDAPFAIQFHASAALIALVLTPVLFWRRKGDLRHRVLGRLWMVALAATALSSFAISEIRMLGPFSPIHILSLISLNSIIMAIVHVRSGNLRGHRRHLVAASLGLAGAGLFTLLPGRVMSRIAFGPAQDTGFAIALGLAALCLAALIVWRFKLQVR